MKKYVIISHSDLRGGAAVASYRLMERLRSEGHAVKMLVKDKQSADTDVVRVGNCLSRPWAFLRERLQIFFHNGFSRRNLFKVSTARYGLRLSARKEVVEADEVIVGWACQGLISLRDFGRILKLKPGHVTVVMHDLWWLTGICHHPMGCTNFHTGCGCCKFLKSNNPSDLSHKVFLTKQAIYGSKPTAVKWVAVSRWLKRMAERSPLITGEVRVEPIPFDKSQYRCIPLNEIEHLKPFKGHKIVVMGAARLDDPVKGIDMAIEALNRLENDRVVALFFGAKRDPHLFDALKIPYVDFGPVSDPELLRDIYASADVVLSSSLYETFGLTLQEGIASGAWGVAFSGDGREDAIADGVNGTLVPPYDIIALASAISAAPRK